jgi:hypothetical protein
MSTLSVTVNHSADAFMLAEWLKNIRFVQDVDVRIDNPPKGNAKAVQQLLNSIKSKQLFADITDPVAYQRQIRDEWE